MVMVELVRRIVSLFFGGFGLIGRRGLGEF